MKEQVIETVKEINYLGIILDNNNELDKQNSVPKSRNVTFIAIDRCLTTETRIR